MRIAFEKYHGTGNDFIMIDIRNHAIPEEPDIIAYLCHRRFGIGADGLIFLDRSDDYDFSMKYFNADGKASTMCGNGGRCITAFAAQLGIIDEEATFEAVDGLHTARVLARNGNEFRVKLKMTDVAGSSWNGDEIILDTGSPHLVKLCSSLDEMDVFKAGRAIRHEERFGPDGINVNFIEEGNPVLDIRTYERGVEAETYSCGTGATAAALALAIRWGKQSPVKLKSKGGDLLVHFRHSGTGFNEIYLEGPASHVFSGSIELKK